MKKNTKYLRNIQIILLFLFLILIFYITHLMASFLVPIFIAFFTALILHPFIEKLHSTKVPNWLSTLIVVLIFIILIGSFLTLLGISFGNFVVDFTKKGGIADKFQNNIIEAAKNFGKIKLVKKYIDTQKLNDLILETAKNVINIKNFQMYIVKPVGKGFDIIKGFLIYALSLIFILPGMSRINGIINKSFPNKNGTKINDIIKNIKTQIQNYMIAKTIVSFGIGLISYLICLIFKVEYALLWGFVVFLFNYIPILGSIIAVIFPMSLSIIQYQNFFHFLFLSISLISAQMIMAYIVEPKFMSKGVNLSPIVIFVSLFIWGYIWGIIGVLISVPLMSGFNLICENIYPLRPIHFLISAKKKTNFFRKNKPDIKKSNKRKQ